MSERQRSFAGMAVQLAVALVLAAPLRGQPVGGDTLKVLIDARRTVERVAADRDAIWPGFRPDTIPVLFVVRERGGLLLGWRGALPEGYTEVSGVRGGGWQTVAARSAASTGARLEGRGVAQVVYGGQSVAWLVGTAVHEAFHVFAGESAREDGRFGQGENSFLVTRYPIFDVENETAFGLEGKLLSAALRAEPDSAATLFVRAFLAVRESRQRELGAELAEFEQQAELNEGLAQYSGVRALRLLAALPDTEWRREAAVQAEEELGDLDGLLDERTVSFRSRYYRTGAAQGLLLDRLAGEGWKAELMEKDLTLQDALALASGYREREMELKRMAASQFDAAALAERARAAIEELRAQLRARVDSALARPGLTLVVETKAIGGVGLCGIDPQNLLQIDEGVLFHARWVRPCAGAVLQAEFTTPVLHDRREGSLRAVIGAADAVQVSVGGQPLELAGTIDTREVRQLELDSPDVKLTAARAEIEMHDGVLRIRPQRD